MIPANIDYVAIVKEMNKWGLGDYKIEAICGFSEGYIRRMKHGAFRDMTYQRAARLYNFWWDERNTRGMGVLTMLVPLFPEKNPALVATT